ncbi:MAG: VOC family protein [Acidimicrobiales bacterium]
MIGHLGIGVGDLAAARSYYDQLMPLVGFEPFLADDDQFAYRPVGGRPGTYLFVYPAADASRRFDATAPGLQHLAFMVPRRGAVDAVHRWAAARGDDVVHEPRQFPEYPPPYYACFWRDPEGFLLEAVCHHDRP